MTIRRFAFFFILAGLLCGADCNTNRHTGDDGRLVFEYESAEDPRNFNKPIIVGGQLDMRVSPVGEAESVELEKVVARNPSVADVASSDETGFRIVGEAAGRARFRAGARDDEGENRVDALDVRVDEVADVRLWANDAIEDNAFNELRSRFAAPGSEPNRPPRKMRAEFEVESVVKIPWTRLSQKGEVLVGYGVEPVRIVPDGAAEIVRDHRDDDYLKLEMPRHETTFSIVPADGLDGDELVVEVVDEHWWSAASIVSMTGLGASVDEPQNEPQNFIMGPGFWLGLWLGFSVASAIWLWQQFENIVPRDESGGDDDHEVQ